MRLPLVILAFILITGRIIAAEAVAPVVSVYEVTSLDGKTSYEVCTEDDVKSERKAKDTEYLEKAKQFRKAASDFSSKKENAGKKFEDEPPVKPTFKAIRQNLTLDDASTLQSKLTTVLLERKKNTFFKSILGTITNKDGPIPFIFLAIPNGSNMLDESVLSKIRGKVDMSLNSYTGTAKLTLPRDGTYIITANRSVKLNGMDLGFMKDSVADLKAGTYDLVLLSDSGNNQLGATNFKIVEKTSHAEFFPYNSMFDIESFMESPIASTIPTEISGWKPDKTNLYAPPVLKK